MQPTLLAAVVLALFGSISEATTDYEFEVFEIKVLEFKRFFCDVVPIKNPLVQDRLKDGDCLTTVRPFTSISWVKMAPMWSVQPATPWVKYGICDLTFFEADDCEGEWFAHTKAVNLLPGSDCIDLFTWTKSIKLECRPRTEDDVVEIDLKDKGQ